MVSPVNLKEPGSFSLPESLCRLHLFQCKLIWFLLPLNFPPHLRFRGQSQHQGPISSLADALVGGLLFRPDKDALQTFIFLFEFFELLLVVCLICCRIFSRLYS
jgi:hypothetical protein